MAKVKNKSKRGAVKRFKLTSTGKAKFKHAFGRHILTSKNSKRKRRISKIKVASKNDLPSIKRMLAGS